MKVLGWPGGDLAGSTDEHSSGRDQRRGLMNSRFKLAGAAHWKLVELSEYKKISW